MALILFAKINSTCTNESFVKYGSVKCRTEKFQVRNPKLITLPDYAYLTFYFSLRYLVLPYYITLEILIVHIESLCCLMY